MTETRAKFRDERSNLQNQILPQYMRRIFMDFIIKEDYKERIVF